MVGHKKKFEIIEEQRFIRKNNSKITIVNESRPRACPRCLTIGSIIKIIDRNYQWECSEEKRGCGYKW